MKPVNSFFHGVCIFMAAFDTGGFSPQSQSILYYHSFIYEIITIIIIVLGALNFKLHYHLWVGNRKEIFKNIETTTFFITVTVIFFIVGLGLLRIGSYPSKFLLFRKGFYQLISAHTTAGFQTIYPQQFFSDWNPLALTGIIMAMALGGAVCSTTGGIKMLRIGIICKAIKEDVKKIIMPGQAVIVERMHHIKEVFLEDKVVRSALIITLFYIILYGLGALIGMFFGNPFLESLFESTSAAANIGLSCGITKPSMPIALKIMYVIQMWAGRLEFMSVFTIFGVLYATIKGK
jgi:trk system potassium uptake protein TrkH